MLELSEGEIEMTTETQSATITYKGQQFDFDAAVNLMDDDIRELVHNITEGQSWNTPQIFFDAYVGAHFDAFGEEFVIN